MTKRVWAKTPILEAGSDDHKKVVAACELLNSATRSLYAEVLYNMELANTGADLSRHTLLEFRENLLVLSDQIDHAIGELTEAIGHTEIVGATKKGTEGGKEP